MSRKLTGPVVIATHNPGKLTEMRELLAPYGIAAQSAGELGLAEPAETGNTFAENARIKAMAAPDAEGNVPDVVITEIGGTVGDIESQPFLEAARQVRHDIGRDNCFFLHVSLVPYLGPSGELKTKPTQHSVAALRNIGIQPDALILRCDRDVPDALKAIASTTLPANGRAAAAGAWPIPRTSMTRRPSAAV